MNNTTIPSVTVRNLVLKTGDPKICVSISDRNQEEILDSARELVKRGADLAEWRADCFKGFVNELLIEDTLSELREVLKDTPLIFTVRTLDEGGRADIKLFDYIKIYRAAARTDLVDIFDIEYKIMYQLPAEVINDIKKHGKIIVSKHDFNSTPEYDDLVDELIRLQVIGGDIAKLAVMPSDEDDVKRLIDASKEIMQHHNKIPIITISMGQLGNESRLKCSETGSCLTFASIGKPSAPGQLPIEEVKQAFNKNKPV